MEFGLPQNGPIEFRKVSLELCRLHPLYMKEDLTGNELHLVKEFQKEFEASGVVVLHSTGNPLAPYSVLTGKEIVKAASIVGLPDLFAFVGEFAKAYHDILEAPRMDSEAKAKAKVVDPIQEAVEYRKMMDKNGWSEREAEKKLKVKRITLNKSLSLLKLHPHVQAMISAGSIRKTHGRILSSLEDKEQQLSVAEFIRRNDLDVSTRQLQKHLSGEYPLEMLGLAEDPNIKSLASRFGEAIGCETKINHTGKSKGKVILKLSGREQLLHFLEKLSRKDKRPLKLSVNLNDDREAGTLQVGFQNDSDLDEIFKRLGFKKN